MFDPISIATAGAGVLGLGSGFMQAEATEDAANTAAGVSRDASALQYKMFQEQQAAMEPWRASGVNALNRLNALMGLPSVNALSLSTGDPPAAPAMPQFGSLQDLSPAAIAKYRQDLDDYYKKLAEYNAGRGGTAPAGPTVNMAKNPDGSSSAAPQDWRDLMDPGYAFRKQEGINALAAAGAASGNYGSGNMGVALQDFGQNLASQEFQNVYNRLAGMSGTGQVQSQAIGSMGVNTGNAMANYLNQAGQNIAQGQIAGANALAGGVRDLGSGITSYYMYKDSGGGGYNGGGYNLDDYYGGSRGGSWGIPID